jgi:hypothetical protein
VTTIFDVFLRYVQAAQKGKMQQETDKSTSTNKLPRPVLLEVPAEFAIAFANIATRASENSDLCDWVARNGKMSIFSALQSVFPEVSHSCYAVYWRSIVYVDSAKSH